MEIRLRRLGWAVALTALAGCGTSVTGPVGLAVGGGQETTVTVSQGTAPTYTWTGGPAQRLVVQDALAGTVAWDIQAVDPATGFASPVSQGVAPQNARVVTTAAILQTGTRYRVVVTLLDGTETTDEFVP